MLDIAALKREFERRPQYINISGVQRLQHFIDSYPVTALKPSLMKLQEHYRYYRPVNGDGNCFYRAMAFLYLREADLSHYQTLFPEADLLKCRNLPLKLQKNVTSKQLLYYLWQTELLYLADQPIAERERLLEPMFNCSVAIDAILIAYFRVLNYDYVVQLREELQPYTANGIQSELQRIITFGKESEGIETYCLAKKLDITMLIQAVHQQGLTEIKYNSEIEGRPYVLFYRPGHYDILDILQPQRQITGRSKRPEFRIPKKTQEDYIQQGLRRHGLPRFIYANSDYYKPNAKKVNLPKEIRLLRAPQIQKPSGEPISRSFKQHMTDIFSQGLNSLKTMAKAVTQEEEDLPQSKYKKTHKKQQKKYYENQVGQYLKKTQLRKLYCQALGVLAVLIIMILAMIKM